MKVNTCETFSAPERRSLCVSKRFSRNAVVHDGKSSFFSCRGSTGKGWVEFPEQYAFRNIMLETFQTS